MVIKQKNIKTEGEKQGEPTNDLEQIDAFPKGGIYQPIKQGEYYFLVAFDKLINDEGLVGYTPEMGQYDMYGDFIGTEMEEITAPIQYTKRTFYLVKTNNGEFIEGNEIGQINTEQSGLAIPQSGAKINKFQLSDSDFVQKNIKNIYDVQYDTKNYLTLSRKAIGKISTETTSFENLCDIILAETIKSYLL